MDHSRVIERIRAGHEDELTLIYKKYRNEFLNWITRSYNCSLEDGKDIYQTIIITFYESIVSGRLIELRSSLKTYLFAIGKNKLQERNRFINKEQTQELTYETDFPVMGDEGEEEERSFQLIEKSLLLLGDPCKSLLQLFYYNKLSINEITAKLNYKNTDTSKNLKYKCIKRLRKIYEDQAESLK